jgi:hypothetical protein
MIASVAGYAQRSQDFASRFVKIHQADTTIQCVTVSPKMMEQIAKSQDESRNAAIRQAIGKLKSARIVTASNCYYDSAEELLKQNATRFQFDTDYQHGEKHGVFYKRKNRKGNTVELIMLHADDKQERLTIVNLTGDLDEDFISSLAQGITGQSPHTD